MKNKLRQSLSDVLAFEDDQARSKSGRIALEIPNNNEVRLFLTLPEPKDPSIFLLMGVLTAFVATTAPELPDPETLIKTSCAELGKGRIASIIKNFEGGRLEIAYDPEHFVFSFDVRRQ